MTLDSDHHHDDGVPAVHLPPMHQKRSSASGNSLRIPCSDDDNNNDNKECEVGTASGGRGYGMIGKEEEEMGGDYEERASAQKKKAVASARPSPFVIRVTAVTAIGGILFGYDLGVISTALPLLKDDFALEESEQDWVVAILYVGGFLGAILGGSMVDSFGRKRSILITDISFMLGALILFLAPTYGIVLLGRIVVGFAVALSGIADICYLNEIAPTEWRGSIVSVNEACVSLGFLIAFAFGSLLSHGDGGANHDAWRIMFGLSGFVALIQFIGMW